LRDGVIARLRAVLRRYEAGRENEAALLKCGLELDRKPETGSRAPQMDDLGAD